jgi:type IV pilus assembly protein PilY1
MMKAQKFHSGAPRRLLTLAFAGFAAAALAADPPKVDEAQGEKFAPEISNMPLGLAANVPPNVMLLLNTGSISHYGYLPTNGDRYDLRASAYAGSVTKLNKPYHSSHINKIYYDPSVEYKKPLGACNTAVSTCVDGKWQNASFNAAPIDGYGVYSPDVTNLSNDFRATHYNNVKAWVADPVYKTDTAAGPSTGVAIGKTAHYALYHPGRVGRNNDGTVRKNPSVLDADGNETWKAIREIPNVAGSLMYGWAVPMQYIVNKGGEAELTYGTSDNPARKGCEFQETQVFGGSGTLVTAPDENRRDFYQFGKFGSNTSDYVFPATYDINGTAAGVGGNNDLNGTYEGYVEGNPQYQVPITGGTGVTNYNPHNWIIRYYNCFEAIRVGEAEDKDEYYPWWKATDLDPDTGNARGPITPAAKRQNFANWYSYYYHPGMLMKTVLSHALNDLDPDTRVGYAVTGHGGVASANNSSDGTGITLNATAKANDGIASNDYVKRGVRPFRDFEAGDPSGYGDDANACTPKGQCKTQLLNWLFKLKGSETGYNDYAAMRHSLGEVGRYYTGDPKCASTSPCTTANLKPTGPWSSTPGFQRAANAETGVEASRFQACRKSYVLTLTGGAFSRSAPTTIDADGTPGLQIQHANASDTCANASAASPSASCGYIPSPPFRDHPTNTLSGITTLADVAMYYWKTDLLTGTVPSPKNDNNVPRSSQDPAYWQHMNVVALHLDTEAYSVDWQRIAEGIKTPSKLAAMVAAGKWGYPGPDYTCTGTAWSGGTGCPNPARSGWGNPNAGDETERREQQPYYSLHGDDLMHAAINSRGFYGSTLNPKEISEMIQAGLSFVRTDNAISMSSIATNTTSSRVPMIYQASFNDDWNGKLLGNRLCTAADVTRDFEWNPATQQATLAQNDSRCREEGELWFKASWDAGKVLQNNLTGRNIVTWNPTGGSGVPFSAATIAAQANGFCVNPACDSDEEDYFRGQPDKEERDPYGGPWRARTDAFKSDETVNRNAKIVPDGTVPRVLGDMINSNVLFVGHDDYGWGSFGGITNAMRQDYRKRKNAMNRPEVVYVGANDGMLHAFDAEAGAANEGTLGSPGNGGKELFAYVPWATWEKLAALRDPEYTHEFYVDGSPTVGDAHLANSNSTEGWNTVLIGSTGAGGSGYFALDVEKPAAFGASNVLWDIRGPGVEILKSGTESTKNITSAPYTNGFGHLGYTYGLAAITLLRNKTGDDKWVAVFPNGYNSYRDLPMLYIVDLENGTLFTSMASTTVKIVNNTDIDYTSDAIGGPTEPNGLSTPALADINGDGINDVAYAGDLRGNLWRFRFDEELGTDGPVHVEKIFDTKLNGGSAQPITGRPEVGRNASGNVMVYFGTGRYVTRSDIADKDVQTFYGVTDLCPLADSCSVTPTGALGRSNLLEQEFQAQKTRGYEEKGATYESTVRVLSDNQLSGEAGFYIDFLTVPSGAKEGERIIHAPVLWGDRVIFNTIIPGDDECEAGGDGWMYEIDPTDGSRLDFAVFDLDHDGKFGDKNDLVNNIPPSGIKVGMGGGVTARGDTKYHSNTKGKVTVIKNNKHPGIGRKSWRQLR